MTDRKNPIDVLAPIIKQKAAQEAAKYGLELADDFDEQIEKWRAYSEELIAYEPPEAESE